MAVKMLEKKKAVIFMITAVLLVGVLIAQTAITTRTTYKQKSFVAVSRINTMNEFIESIEEDVPRSMLIAGYRGVISMQKYIAVNASFLSDVQGVFEEIFLNGTVAGVEQDLMANSSISDWEGRINEEAQNLNINFSLSSRSVRIYHRSPWSVTIELNATFNVDDANGLAHWIFNESFNTTISILSFEDPLYTVKSQDMVTKLVLAANNTDFVDSATNDTTVLYIHLNNTYYVASGDAPSFLMRFEGNLSNSTFGIESLVNLEDFSKQSLPTYARSVVDYQYFDDSYDASGDKCSFPGMPSWFRMGPSKLDDYELAGLGEDC